MGENPKFYSTLENIIERENVKGIVYGYTPENPAVNEYMDSVV